MEILNDLAYLKKYVEEIYKKNDPSHDFGHIMRVYKNAETICKTEKANKKLVLISVLLHDIVKKSQYDKRRESSADLSATKSTRILKKLNFSNINNANVKPQRNIYLDGIKKKGSERQPGAIHLFTFQPPRLKLYISIKF